MYPVFGTMAICGIRRRPNAWGQPCRPAWDAVTWVGNLAVTSLVTNAFLLTGQAKYRTWVLSYLEAWGERAERNGGLLPDNVGLSGTIGEYLEGRWYGGLYGWAWPHGYYNIGQAVTVACANACLLTGDDRFLDLARTQYDRIMDLGQWQRIDQSRMSMPGHWLEQFQAMPAGQDHTFLVPYRHNEEGWFDWQPMGPMYPFALWNLTGNAADHHRIQRLQEAERGDWSQVFSYRLKEDAGHEKPWFLFLAGQNPGYPEAILDASLQQVRQRLAMIRDDRADLQQVHIHHWQQHNPVTTEALVQLTLGAPQHLYNGGLLHAPIRHFDGESGRPGLPPDIAVLVCARNADSITLEIVNTSHTQSRSLLIQAGAFGEHQFEAVHIHDRLDYAESTACNPTSIAGASQRTQVDLRPLHAARLTLVLRRFAHAPQYT